MHITHVKPTYIARLNPLAFGLPAEEEVPVFDGIEDSNPVENMNDTGSYGYYNPAIWGVACSFTAHEGGKLDRATVWARRNANADHQPLTAHIYECTQPVDTAVPEGASLAASDPFDSELIVLSPDIQPIEFHFTGANQIQFEKGKVYCLSVERPNTNSADVIRFGFYMGVQLQHPGVFSEARTVGWIKAASGFDLIFYVHSTQ